MDEKFTPEAFLAEVEILLQAGILKPETAEAIRADVAEAVGGKKPAEPESEKEPEAKPEDESSEAEKLFGLKFLEK